MVRRLLILLLILPFSRCDVKIYRNWKEVNVNTTIDSILNLKHILINEDATEAEIHGLNVPILPNNSLEGVSLNYFRVSGCNLNEIQPGALKGAYIDSLILRGNKIEVLERSIFNRRIFNVIDLSQNNIYRIENGAFEYSVIRSLSLNNNKLANVTAAMFKHSNISVLMLANNKIAYIEDETFSYITRLSHLDLSHNELKRIGTLFNNLPHLFELNLSFNEINFLPSASFIGSNISWIFLTGNNLKRIDKGVFNAKPFGIISLDYNEIEIIEEGAFADIPRLYQFYLGGNKLGDLKSKTLGGIEGKIVWFSLHGNGISNIDADALRNLNVKTLDLGNNTLHAVRRGMFEGLSVETLILRYNELSSIENGAFEGIRELKYINLSNNKLKKIKKGMINIPMNNVILNDNNINTIDKEALGELPLDMLSLDNNPIIKKLH